MKYFYIVIAISGVVILLMNIILFTLITLSIKNIRETAIHYQNELKRAFGWDEYDWADNFYKYKKESNKALEKVKKIEQLPVIQEAVKFQTLENLETQKGKINKELERLQR